MLSYIAWHDGKPFIAVLVLGALVVVGAHLVLGEHLTLKIDKILVNMKSLLMTQIELLWDPEGM